MGINVNDLSGQPEHVYSGGLKGIEGSIFFTKINTVLFLTVSAVCSLILGVVIVKPFSLAALPFYGYSAACVMLLYLALKHRFELDGIIVFKVLLDAVLTVYWIDMHAWQTGTTYFYFLPVVTLLTNVVFNVRLSEYRYIHLAIYMVILGNGVVFHRFVDFSRYSVISSAVYYLVSGLCIWAHVSHSRFKETVHNDLATKEERISNLVNSRKTFSLSTRIVHHEISNDLMRLSRCVNRLKSRQPEEFKREIEDIRYCIEHVPGYIRMLSDHQVSPTVLRAVLNVVLPSDYIRSNVPEGAVVFVPMMLLVSFVGNIFENAQQAFERRFGTLDGFIFRVYLQETTLCFEDNAGGFDVDAIELGKSSKGTGHGIFLATFLSDTGYLGMKTSIERMENGTRVMIGFDRIEKPVS